MSTLMERIDALHDMEEQNAALRLKLFRAQQTLDGIRQRMERLERHIWDDEDKIGHLGTCQAALMRAKVRGAKAALSVMKGRKYGYRKANKRHAGTRA